MIRIHLNVQITVDLLCPFCKQYKFRSAFLCDLCHFVFITAVCIPSGKIIPFPHRDIKRHRKFLFVIDLTVGNAVLSSIQNIGNMICLLTGFFIRININRFVFNDTRLRDSDSFDRMGTCDLWIVDHKKYCI